MGDDNKEVKDGLRYRVPAPVPVPPQGGRFIAHIESKPVGDTRYAVARVLTAEEAAQAELERKMSSAEHDLKGWVARYSRLCAESPEFAERFSDALLIVEITLQRLAEERAQSEEEPTETLPEEAPNEQPIDALYRERQVEKARQEQSMLDNSIRLAVQAEQERKAKHEETIQKALHGDKQGGTK